MQTLLLLFATVLGSVAFFLVHTHHGLGTGPSGGSPRALAALFILFSDYIFVPDSFLGTQKSDILAAASAAMVQENSFESVIFLLAFATLQYLASRLPSLDMRAKYLPVERCFASF